MSRIAILVYGSLFRIIFIKFMLFSLKFSGYSIVPFTCVMSFLLPLLAFYYLIIWREYDLLRTHTSLLLKPRYPPVYRNCCPSITMGICREECHKMFIFCLQENGLPIQNLLFLEDRRQVKYFLVLDLCEWHRVNEEKRCLSRYLSWWVPILNLLTCFWL